MNTCDAIRIYEGIAIGEIHLYRKNIISEDMLSGASSAETGVSEDALSEIPSPGSSVSRNTPSGASSSESGSPGVHQPGPVNPLTEKKRFKDALDRVIAERQRLSEYAGAALGKDSADIFESHIILLNDTGLNVAVLSAISDGHMTAADAVRKAFDEKAAHLSNTGDVFIQERSADIRDLKNTLVRILSGFPSGPSFATQSKDPFILAADDLTPSEIVRIPRDKLAGVILKYGSPTSHTSVILREMGIPSVVKCADISDDWEGHQVILDANTPLITLDPDVETIERYNTLVAAAMTVNEYLDDELHSPAHTKAGRQISVLANISSTEDINRALEYGADGVGLFRTEYLYIGKSEAPSENEQLEVYRSVLERMDGRPVTIRTADIGSDKLPEYMKESLEADRLNISNPALGIRGVRFSLLYEDIFRTQLRALIRSSRYGDLRILIPMISDVWEAEKCIEIINECKRELSVRSAETDSKNPKDAFAFKIGLMIETPAAALISDELAERVDFFSIGTNDLTQYTCAIDRDLGDAYSYIEGIHAGGRLHPALLRLIEMTVNSARRHNIPVGICGELASEDSHAATFVRMGVDELSMNSRMIPIVKNAIREI